MATKKLTRIKMGLNKKAARPMWYVEARVNPERPWSLLTDGKRWITHRTEAAAIRAAATLEKRLQAKLAGKP